MQYVIRNWNCRNCGRSNKTEMAQDGTVKCEFCSDVLRIQPARSRAGQTPTQGSRFAARTP